MRATTYDGNGVMNGSFTSPGLTMTGTLILDELVTNAMQAVHKLYVDTVANSLSASNINYGTLSAARFPAMTGDVTSANGTANLVLAATGVTPGTYPKVTVDAKGRVTAGDVLSASDIPSLDWSKITSGLPTTATGYGITDGVNLTNSIVYGNLTINGTPTAANHAVTKAYADAHIVTGGMVSGTIISKFTNVTPSGFLRCNGAEVSKTTYADLYAAIGDTFTYFTTPGSGKPWRNQYDINLVQSGDITGWTAGTALAGTVSTSHAIVTKNRVYLIGGIYNGAPTSTSYTAPINSDGTLGTWTGGPNLPVPVSYSQAIVTKNRVYLLGNDATSVVYTNTINSDGTLGTWATGTSLPGALYASQAVVTKNRVYLLGGYNASGMVRTVYTAPINSDGTLGTWTTGTSLPATFAQSAAIVTKNRVYLLGGMNSVSSTVSTVYTAPINSDGTLGTWTGGPSLPGAVNDVQAVVTKNRVYVLGGQDGTNTLSSVYTAIVNADGTLGTWMSATFLSAALRKSQAIVTSSRIYLIGGDTGAGGTSAVYSAPFSGGTNDYSQYYDGTALPTDPANFRIPDLTSREIIGKYFYIVT